IATASALVMLLIAAPATALRLGSSDASNDPAGKTTHRAYGLLAQGFGQGFNGPLLVVAKVPHGTSTVEALRAAIAAAPGVTAVAPARMNPTRNVALITVYPRSSPQAYATTQ